MDVLADLILASKRDRVMARAKHDRLRRKLDVAGRLEARITASAGRARIEAAACLFAIEPDRAIELGLHRDPETRDEICLFAVTMQFPGEDARLVARMLEDPDPVIVQLAFTSGLVEGVCTHDKQLLPLDLLRVRARDPDRRIRRGALEALAHVHLPEDAPLVVESIEGGEPAYPIAWLAPLPASGRLAPWLSMDELAELLCRRRCAGLSNVGLVDGIALARDRANAPLLPGKLVRELRDERLLRAWFPRRSLQGPGEWNDAHETILSFGAAALALVHKRAERERGSDVRSLADELYLYLRKHRFDRHAAPPYEAGFPATALAAADTAFAVDDLDSSVSAATAHYARILYFAPRNAHAALQLAWIDRGFGSPILPARIAWLRSLGVRDEALLEELAVPVAPWPTQHGKRRSTGPLLPMQRDAGRPLRDAHLARVRLATAGVGS